MNFYDFCLIWEKTVYDALADNDKFLFVYRLADGSFDFSSEKTDDNIGSISFNRSKIYDKKNIASVEASLVYTPADGLGAKANDYKLELFHLARDKSDSKADQIYKNEFYSATVYKTVSILKTFEPDLIIYIDSKSPFNRDVIAQLNQVNVQSINNITKAKPLKKKTYQFIQNELEIDPSRINLFVTTKNAVKQTDKTRGQITAIALRMVMQNLANGKSYQLKDRVVNIESPLSRQITANMIAQEWKPAAEELAAERRKYDRDELAKSDYSIGTDGSKILDLLTSYGHFDAQDFREPGETQIKTIAVIDDNINSCSTYEEVNSILKRLEHTKNAQIRWVVGVIKDPTGDRTSCFK
jgi:hypothetical protein